MPDALAEFYGQVGRQIMYARVEVGDFSAATEAIATHGHGPGGLFVDPDGLDEVGRERRALLEHQWQWSSSSPVA